MEYLDEMSGYLVCCLSFSRKTLSLVFMKMIAFICCLPADYSR